MQVQRTLNRREGVWGIVKGDKGGASQVAPLSPLTKYTKIRIIRDVSLTLNMTMNIFCMRYFVSLRGEAEAINRMQSLES